MCSKVGGVVSVMHFSANDNGLSVYQPRGILEVPFANTLEPLAVLITRIQQKILPMEIQEVRYLGTRMDLQKNIDIGSLLLDWSSSESLLSVYTVYEPPGDTEIKIYVRTLSGQSLEFDVTRNISVERLKQKIQRVEGIPPDQQRIVFEGKQLEDGRTLKDYEVQNKSVLHLILRLRGGGCPPVANFTDLESNNIQCVQFSPKAPAWRRVSSGINIEGFCENKNCCAFGQCVVAPVGFGQANIISETFKCPMCSKNFKPKTCGFNNCEWNFIGMKAGEGRLIQGEFKEAGGGHYERFRENDKKADWIHLIIVSRKTAWSSACTICLENIQSKNRYVTRCGHTFHENCIRNFSKVVLQKAACPVCRNTNFMK